LVEIVLTDVSPGNDILQLGLQLNNNHFVLPNLSQLGIHQSRLFLEVNVFHFFAEVLLS
jgi:hypothetical protein